MRQLFLLDNICSMHTSTVNKSYFIKDLACGPSLGLQNLMWPSGLKSLPTSALDCYCFVAALQVTGISLRKYNI